WRGIFRHQLRPLDDLRGRRASLAGKLPGAVEIVQFQNLKVNEEFVRRDQQAKSEAGQAVHESFLQYIHVEEPENPLTRQHRVDPVAEKPPTFERVAEDTRAKFLVTDAVTVAPGVAGVEDL